MNPKPSDPRYAPGPDHIPHHLRLCSLDIFTAKALVVEPVAISGFEYVCVRRIPHVSAPSRLILLISGSCAHALEPIRPNQLVVRTSNEQLLRARSIKMHDVRRPIPISNCVVVQLLVLNSDALRLVCVATAEVNSRCARAPTALYCIIRVLDLTSGRPFLRASCQCCDRVDRLVESLAKSLLDDPSCSRSIMCQVRT